MASGDRPIRIGLLSPQSNRNLGDTAIYEAAVAAYRRRLPTVELIAVVPEPGPSARLLGTAGFPLHGSGPFVPATGSAENGGARGSAPRSAGRVASLRRIYGFVGGLDAIVFTGGGLLDDFWGGAGQLPYWILVWTASARARGVPVSFHGVGVDRLSSRASRALVLTALRLARHRSFRDAESLRMLEGMGLSAPAEVIPDLAFALEPAPRPAPSTEPYVVVNPVAASMWMHAPDASYQAYLESFVALSRRLLDRGLRVKLLSTQDAMDAAALHHVAGALHAEGRAGYELLRVTRLDELMAVAAGARLVVSSRLHGLILALVAGTPVVSVSPMRKMTRLMLDAALGDFDLTTTGLQPDALIATVEKALAEEPRLRQRIDLVASEYRGRVHESFDALLTRGLLGERARRATHLEGQPGP